MALRPDRSSGGRPARAFLALVAAGLLALSACAGGPDRRPPGPVSDGPSAAGYTGSAVKPVALLLGAMDANGDHLVDGAELREGIDHEWLLLSQSGPVRPVYYDTWARAALGSASALPSFESFDLDVDKLISREEFDDRLRRAFTELDGNGDGVLERSELVFYVTRPAGRGSPPRPRR